MAPAIEVLPDEGPVLALGATGGQGGAVAAALLRAGRPVRALVRDPASPRARQLSAAGAQLAVGEFTDGDALAAVGWTSFTAWADRALGSRAPATG
jgi:nucleoside-diphosphate-sugar epimerase